MNSLTIKVLSAVGCLLVGAVAFFTHVEKSKVAPITPPVSSNDPCRWATGNYTLIPENADQCAVKCTAVDDLHDGKSCTEHLVPLVDRRTGRVIANYNPKFRKFDPPPPVLPQ
jgi:hypothetical protein